MKHRLFPLFLALLLTGCSMQTDTSAPESPTETLADPAVDSLAESPAETESTALPPVDHPEDAAYTFIRDTLIPHYGLSKPWTVIQPITYKGTGFTCKDLPAEAHGIISAVVQDFDGNGDPEIVTLMLKHHSFILELYCPFDGTYALCGVYAFLTYWDNVSYNPKLWVQDDLLLMTNDSLTCDPAHEQDAAFTAMCQDMYLGDMPDVACVSAELTAVRVTDKGFTEEVRIQNTLTPGKEVFSANGEELTAAVGGMDYDKAHVLACKVLDHAGVRYDPDKFYTDWGILDNVQHGGLSLTLTDAEPVFEIDFGNQTIFSDYTNLYAMTASE